MCVHHLRMFYCLFFFKQKTAYEILASDWSSDVCSSDLGTNSVSPEFVPANDSSLSSVSPELVPAKATSSSVLDRKSVV